MTAVIAREAVVFPRVRRRDPTRSVLIECLLQCVLEVRLWPDAGIPKQSVNVCCSGMLGPSAGLA